MRRSSLANTAHRPILRVAAFVIASCLAVPLAASPGLPRMRGDADGEPVTVRHAEGIVHGFLVLRTLDGTAIADGDLIQTTSGDRVTAQLVFHFKDGSLHDETAVFTQQRQFRLVSDHLVQKGPTFPQPLDLSIDAATGAVSVRYTDNHGRPKTESERMDLPANLSNGMILTLLKNVRPNTPPASLSMVAATPAPRLVKLKISAAGAEPFSTGRMNRMAAHYILKVDLGGLTGMLAPLFGKQPPDSHVWILRGPAPAFVKSEQPLYVGGPVWRIELVSPVWPRVQSSSLSGGAASPGLAEPRSRPTSSLPRGDSSTAGGRR